MTDDDFDPQFAAEVSAMLARRANDVTVALEPSIPIAAMPEPANGTARRFARPLLAAAALVALAVIATVVVGTRGDDDGLRVTSSGTPTATVPTVEAASPPVAPAVPAPLAPPPAPATAVPAPPAAPGETTLTYRDGSPLAMGPENDHLWLPAVSEVAKWLSLTAGPEPLTVTEVLEGGFTVETTFDRDAVEAAASVAADAVPDNDLGITMGMAVIDNATGAVRALEADSLAEPRPVGSAAKAVILAAAFDQGFFPEDTISGEGPCSEGIENFGNSVGGIDTLSNQLYRSSICAFLRLALVVGSDTIRDLASSVGLDWPCCESELALGSAAATPLQMAGAYSIFVNGGVYRAPYLIERVLDSEGRALYERPGPSGELVIGEGTACSVTQVLATNVQRGTGTRAGLEDGRSAAGKTGTLADFTNAWFVGFTPGLTTAVWMGGPDGLPPVPMVGVGGINVTGGSFPAEAWGAFNRAWTDPLVAPAAGFGDCEPSGGAGGFIGTDPSSSPADDSICPAEAPFGTDTNGDGVMDLCIPYDPALPPPPDDLEAWRDPIDIGGPTCPEEFPRGVDTDGDGQVDRCFKT